MGRVFGIDLGTTNSAIATFYDGKCIVIPSATGYTISSAISHQTKIETISIYETKRLIGKDYSSDDIQDTIRYLTYKVKEAKDGSISIPLGEDIALSPEEIAASVLHKLKVNAESYLTETVNDVVITVPAYFSIQQRKATLNAASIAGLNCLRILNEPTAAMLNYTHTNGNVLVYDIGGGTVDCSIVNVDNNILEVLTSTGNTHLGGTDFDNAIIDHCINTNANTNTNRLIEITNDTKIQAEIAKVKLAHEDYHIKVKNAYKENGIVKSIDKLIRQTDLPMICGPLLTLCMKPIHEALVSVNFSYKDINKVLLVGGMTKMPLLRDCIKTFFHGLEPSIEVNPDLAVATGAAIQGYLMSGNTINDYKLLLDVTSMSLGIKTINDSMNVIIPKGRTIPTNETRIYTNSESNTEAIKIEIYEGESLLVTQNTKVTDFDLIVPPGPKASARISVTFRIDVNGDLTVTAEDTKSQSKAGIITNKDKSCITLLDTNNNNSIMPINELKKEKENEIKTIINSLIGKTDISEIIAWLETDIQTRQIEDIYEFIQKLYDEYSHLMSTGETTIDFLDSLCNNLSKTTRSKKLFNLLQTVILSLNTQSVTMTPDSYVNKVEEIRELENKERLIETEFTELVYSLDILITDPGTLRTKIDSYISMLVNNDIIDFEGEISSINELANSNPSRV